MADDRAMIRIDADVSRVEDGAQRARSAIGGIGQTVEKESKNLNRYGERLSKALGPGQGLRGSVENLEMPLRDVEGSFDRVAMATRVWGNASETASEKATVGFLLAADSIATFTSGGIAGIAIAAGVAGFALLAQAISKETEEAKKAEEATKKQAEALQELAKSAGAANITIALLSEQTREKEVRARAREVEQERIDTGNRLDGLIAQYRRFDAQRKATSDVRRINAMVAAKESTDKLIRETRTRYNELSAEHAAGEAKIRAAHERVASEVEKNQANALTRLMTFLDKATTESTKVIEKETKKRAVAVETFTQLMTRVAESDKARTEEQQALRKENEDWEKRHAEKNKESLQLDADFESAVLAAKVQDQEDAALAILGINEKTTEAQSKLSQDMAKSEEMRAQAVSSSYKAATRAVTNELFNMAKAGEFSFGKLAEAATMAAGQSLVSEGTRVLLVGISKLFNPITFPVGVAESKHGSIMIGAGLAMGAIGGAVSRSSETPAASGGASSTPTDTRQSRAASTTAEGGGGTTIITFNGPAYDRRGVSEVITSGQRMARHRRIAGA